MRREPRSCGWVFRLLLHNRHFQKFRERPDDLPGFHLRGVTAEGERGVVVEAQGHHMGRTEAHPEEDAVGFGPVVDGSDLVAGERPIAAPDPEQGLFHMPDFLTAVQREAEGVATGGANDGPEDAAAEVPAHESNRDHRDQIVVRRIADEGDEQGDRHPGEPEDHKNSFAAIGCNLQNGRY